ncbi:S66 peptidase family protein [Pedobacter cryoconitis]|uniref:Muramoyltetrapeptide carboxypeptidase n=1 Tax=Pedobacter cryoconitis TaxID=188932 RepID=A0A327SZ99_9SPHI|nr:LD-carboxypeptidase [Pedobacter cryoconitis]RAJ34218.1 muramoyltetrapeptide carboxypeptidase [Pedobacter cryoconitis]
MNIQPLHLKKGDKIAIVCPANKLKKSITPAVSLFESWGLQVIQGKSVHAAHFQFAGTDELRAADLQTFLDDVEIKAILAARGGYGGIRILDQLDFTSFNKCPKWIAGFSDTTALLSHIQAAFNIQSIHGQMPASFETGTPLSLETLRKALFGEALHYSYSSIDKNRHGQAEGILIGGNLSLLVAMQGSISEMDYAGKILFLEDVGEHEYAIDRMLRMLKRGGKLAGLKGLIIGAFNEIEPQEIPFGQTPEELIMEIVREYDYPVCFNFPVGHIADNNALIIGRNAIMKVGYNEVKLAYK